MGQRNYDDPELSSAEYLSRFGKDDTIIPIITAVFYYGTKEWDGSVDLYGMFAEHGFMDLEVMQKYIPNYWINLIDADKVEDIECFETDLKEIFGLMKCRKDKQALLDYVRANEAYFRHVDSGTYRAIGELLQSKKILENEVYKEEKEGEKDMCKALEDMCLHAEERAVKETAKRFFQNGASYEMVKNSIPSLSEEELQVIYAECSV